MGVAFKTRKLNKVEFEKALLEIQKGSTVENALAHRTFPGYRYSVMLEGLRDALRMRNKPTQEMQPR